MVYARVYFRVYDIFYQQVGMFLCQFLAPNFLAEMALDSVVAGENSRNVVFQRSKLQSGKLPVIHLKQNDELLEHTPMYCGLSDKMAFI